MPKYFFHIDSGVQAPDVTGTELPDIAEARNQAVQAAGTMLRELDGRFWEQDRHSWTMHVTDEEHRLLFMLKVSAETPSGEVTYRPRSL